MRKHLPIALAGAALLGGRDRPARCRRRQGPTGPGAATSRNLPGFVEEVAGREADRGRSGGPRSREAERARAS